MSAPEHVSLTLSEYVRQVEQACSDLQPPVRHRLLADLEAHLRDQADGADLEATLGSPTEYARELRTAMDLPEAAPTPDSVGRRRWLIPALIAGVALAVILGLIAIIVATVSSQPSVPGPKPTTSALPTASPSSAPATIVVPSVIGTTKASAIAQIEAAGLTFAIKNVKDTAAPAGRVVTQSPAAFSVVVPGSRVTLGIATS